MPSKKSTSPAVIPKRQINGAVILAENLTRAKAQFARLKDSDRENALRGVFLGGLLHQIKAEAGHGKFMALAKKELPEIPSSTRNELMRLWNVLATKIKLKAGDTIALPDAQLALADHAGSAVVKAALKFVGDKSLHDLMTEHGVRDTKKLGGARATAAEEPAPLDAEQLYLFKVDEIGTLITQAETLLVKENALQHLTGHPEQIRGVVASLRALADQVETAAKPILKTEAAKA